MKIAVMGAGAVGSYFGARLTKAGEDVTLIARGKQLEALQQKPLIVHSIKGDFEIKVKATDTPTDPVDLILFTVKSYDTETAIELCKPIITDNTIIMSLQNGVDNEEKIGNAIGKEKVIPALTRIGISLESPGVLNHQASGLIVFGEDNGEKTERITEISNLFEKANLDYKVSGDINYEIWSKYMFNIAFNQLCAITHQTCGKLIKEQKKLAELVLKEVVEVGKAKGVSLTNENVTKTLTLKPIFENFKPSMLQDVEKGKKIEFEAFSGTVVKYGKELGIPTPYNYTVYTLLKGINNS